MKKTLLYALIGLCAAVSLPSAQAPQTPQGPTFQVSVNYVDVDVTVTDAAGNFVSGLSRDDFQVFEDGKPQKVDTFSYVEIPTERQPRFLVAGRPVTTDVRSNRQAAAGRVYMIVLDDMDVGAMRTPRSARARASSSRNISAPTTWPPSWPPAGAATWPRNSPAIPNSCWRPSTSSWAGACGRPRKSGSTTTTHRN